MCAFSGSSITSSFRTKKYSGFGKGQATDAAQYVKLLNRLVAAGQGLSYEAVARDMSGSTYSSTRQNLIEDGMTYADEVELLTEVIDEIYESFLISAVLADKLHIPDFWAKKDIYFAHEWVKPPKPWIDPAKEATATQTAIIFPFSPLMLSCLTRAALCPLPPATSASAL